MTNLATNNFAGTWQISTVLFVEYGSYRKVGKWEIDESDIHKVAVEFSRRIIWTFIQGHAHQGVERVGMLKAQQRKEEITVSWLVGCEFPRLVKGCATSA